MNNSNEDSAFEELLEHIRQERGFDFTGYKRASLRRRVTKQMHSHNIESFGDYLDYLQVHPEEFLPLFNTILINVTAFFRDASAWKYLENNTLPRLLNQKSSGEIFRAWCAGCASGEEAYSLAMLLAETLEMEQFRQRVKIYATDVDEEALTQARHASYTSKEVEPIPQKLRERYLEQVGERYVFRSDLRRGVIFGRHDLLQDAPISRLDLLVCRNTLMYFNAETQAKILDRFHFALNNNGILFLGKAEMLLSHSNLFVPIILPHRIFRLIPRTNRRNRSLLVTPKMKKENYISTDYFLRLQELVFDASPTAEIVVDLEGNLVLVNSTAQYMFDINRLDVGRPLQDLKISYRPLELRSYLDQIYEEPSTILVENVIRHLPEEKIQHLEVKLIPLQENDGTLIGAQIVFTDVTPYYQLQEELQRATQELETTKEELQSSNEELETTKEELQSINEELETTNEELQSTNEELETMNEELQSTNEELQTINDELRLRTNELNQANYFLESVFASLQLGVIVVDRQFNILVWNHKSEDLWGLRNEEVENKSLLGLDIGLPVEQLREPLRNCLEGINVDESIILAARNRRGQDFQCRLTFYPLSGIEMQLRGVILWMEAIE